jgi:hypothetical protein
MDTDKLQAQLTTTYEQAENSKDPRSFFTHLFHYFEIYNSDQNLADLSVKEMSVQQDGLDPEDFANLPDFSKPESPQVLSFMTKWLTNSLTDDKKQGQLFYCWVRLTYFYNMRRAPIDKPNQYSKQLTYKMNLMVLKNEFKNIYKLNDDGKNHVFNTSQFKLCLEIFHPWLIQLINDNLPKTSPHSSSTQNITTHDIPEADIVSNDIISLGIKGRVLWLLVNKQYAQKIKRFDSKSNNNFKACRELLRHRSAYLTKDSMGIVNAKSPIKDLPKTMGLKDTLVDYFVDVDIENNKLRFLDNVEIPHDDLPNLITYVKNNFQERQDTSDS